MPKYRTVTPVTYIHDEKVVSVAAERVIELTDDQAEALGDAVVLSAEEDSFFPTGSPTGFHVPEVVEVDPKTLVSGLPRPKK